MEPDPPEVVRLRADLNRDREHPAGRWRVWRNNGNLLAWLRWPDDERGSEPPIVLRDATERGLRERVAAFEHRYAHPDLDDERGRSPLMQAYAEADGMQT